MTTLEVLRTAHAAVSTDKQLTAHHALGQETAAEAIAGGPKARELDMLQAAIELAEKNVR